MNDFSFVSGSNNGAKSSSHSESKGSRSDMEPPADRGERGQSRGGARGGKPNPTGNDSGLGAFPVPSAPNLDSEIERFVLAILYDDFSSCSLLVCWIFTDTRDSQEHMCFPIPIPILSFNSTLQM